MEGRGVAIVLGAYRGHIWYKYEEEPEPLQDHEGTSWYWRKEEFDGMMEDGRLKRSKKKNKKNKKNKKKKKNNNILSGTAVDKHPIEEEEEEEESEDEEDDPAVVELAGTLAQCGLGGAGFNNADCINLVLMTGGEWEGKVQFGLLGCWVVGLLSC